MKSANTDGTEPEAEADAEADAEAEADDGDARRLEEPAVCWATSRFARAFCALLGFFLDCEFAIEAFAALNFGFFV